MTHADAQRASTTGDVLDPLGVEDVEQSIPQRFARVVALRPHAIAVLALDRSLTYVELDCLADRVAAAIRTRLGDAEEAVAILLDQGPDAIVAILAALKAGKLYVALEPSSPVARLRAMLDDASARLVVSGRTHSGCVEALVGAGRSVLWVEEASETPADAGPALPLAPDRLAYLFYTSGSTGQPKGVVDCHRNVLHNVMRYTCHLGITARDRLSLVQSPSFSGTVSSLFSALLNGGVICPFPMRSLGFGPMASWVNDCGVTIYHSVPLIFRAIAGHGARFPTVRVVRLEGDQALPGDVELFRAHFESDCVLAIGLGATETGLSCQYRIDATTKIGGGVVPVGYPTRDMSVVILDEAGRDVAAGAAGEIGIRSRYLALGYWRQPQRTAERFVPDPSGSGMRIYRTGDLGRLRADGCVEFLGRRDFQPRIRGQYVDAGEVEAALTRIPGIREAAVAAREDAPGEARLVAYLVVEDGFAPNVGAVRTALAPQLPDPMIPSALVVLDRLPLDGNGKLDRRALAGSAPEAVTLPAAGATAEGDVEQRLLAIWEQHFARVGLRTSDDFFDLGGDSLLAARIALAIDRAFGTRLSPNALREAPTVAQLAARVRGAPRADNAHGLEPTWACGDQTTDLIVPMRTSGARPPLVFVHDHGGGLLCYTDLVRRLGADQPCYGLRSPWEQAPERAPDTLEAMATHYRERLQGWLPRGPYQLCGFCFGGVLAFEIARQLGARGEEVAFLGLIAVTPHDFPNLVTPGARRLFAMHAARSGVVERLGYYSARLDGLSWSESLHYLRGRARLMVSGLRDRARLRPRTGAARAVPQETSALRKMHDARFAGYVPKPFGGRAMLFLSAPSVAPYSSNPARDWQPLADQGVDVRVLPVSAMMSEPSAKALATQMLGELAPGPRTRSEPETPG